MAGEKVEVVACVDVRVVCCVDGLRPVHGDLLRTDRKRRTDRVVDPYCGIRQGRGVAAVAVNRSVVFRVVVPEVIARVAFARLKEAYVGLFLELHLEFSRCAGLADDAGIDENRAVRLDIIDIQRRFLFARKDDLAHTRGGDVGRRTVDGFRHHVVEHSLAIDEAGLEVAHKIAVLPDLEPVAPGGGTMPPLARREEVERVAGVHCIGDRSRTHDGSVPLHRLRAGGEGYVERAFAAVI